ncbi:transient receptor potential cation channel subfamily M member 2-like [Pelodytes ibericus]
MGNTKSRGGSPDRVAGTEVHSPYHRADTANHKKKKMKKTSPKFLDGETLNILNSWVSQNIKKKECVTFIPKGSPTWNGEETCCCGHAHQTHFSGLAMLPALPGAAWDRQKHVREFPSDAHGDMTFTGTTRTYAKYVRASSDTRPHLLFELMTQQWGLSVPNLLISVTGGAKNFNINPRLKNQFGRGLVTAAQSTGAWIITGGSHAGVMRHVGEAVRDFSDSDIVLIGITTWGIVHNRQYLMSQQEGAPALYPMDEGSQGELCCLNNNHTHFILVDDGTHGQYGVEIPLRIKLEKFISEQTMEKSGTAIKIPIVCVVVEGGPGTLDTIYNSMCNNTPCVIVEGSGRVATIISQVANLSPSKITISLIKEKLQTLFLDTYSSFTEQQIIMWTKKIQDIVRMQSLLTILREEQEGEQGMDVAILQALLKASRSTDHHGQDNWDHQLKLAVSWNRPDIAQSQIFTEDWMWQPSDLYPSFMASLIDNKPSFVRLFLDRGVSLSDFLTWESLTYLYNNTEQASLIHSKLERQVLLDGSHGSSELPIQLYHVSQVLRELLGDITEPLYPETRSRRLRTLAQINNKMNGKVSSWKESVDPVSHHLEHPVRDLLIWCIVQNRAELADIIWNVIEDCVVGALGCSKILKELSKEEEDIEYKEAMMALANVYEERAVGVFSECYRNDEKRAELLLIRVSPKWGKTTSLELAQGSHGLAFMSQGGVQMFLTKTWWGKLSVDNSFIQLLLCMLLFPLIYSGLINYRMGLENSHSSFKTSLNGTSPRIQNVLKSNRQKPVFSGLPPYSCLWKFLAFFNAPVVKFYYNVVSYIGFLWLFAYVLMIDFQTYPSWKEYLLYVWVASILSEELRQLLYDPDRLGFVTKAVQYISEFWNQIDTMALCLFAVGLICRLANMNTVYLGRVFLSLDFMIFCARVLHIFTVSRVLGPKIIILHQMFKDIFFFLFLLAIWIVAYGVAKQSILISNETRLDWIFRSVVYDPYLTLFGQITSDVDGLNFSPTKCTENGTDPNLPKCAYNDGNGNALFPEWLTMTLMCIYLLLANVLLLNLLIAMFSYTFSEVESHTDQVWMFYRFGLIKEYNERPTAPPPFILFSHIYLFCKRVIFRNLSKSHKALRRGLDESAESAIISWEAYMRDNYKERKKEQEKQSQEHLVKNTSDSVSAMLRLLNIERGADGQRLEERLAILEQQMVQSTQYLNWIMSALTEKGFSSKTRILVHSSSLESEGKNTALESVGDKTSLYHVNARILLYPLCNVTRYPVPDEMVPWEVSFPNYDPPCYIAERNDRGSYDPNYEMILTSRRYNALDGLFDFRSSCGTYTVKEGMPLNPMGRTGLRGVGSLRWFGPNHSLHLVLTCWSLRHLGVSQEKMNRKMLEVLVVKHRNNELWALPGGTLDPGKKIPSKLQSILKPDYLMSFMKLLETGTEVFHGYLDDPRNTDNSWIETQGINIHLQTWEDMDSFLQNLHESDSEISVRWQLLDRKIPLFANEKEILQWTAEHHGAHY